MIDQQALVAGNEITTVFKGAPVNLCRAAIPNCQKLGDMCPHQLNGTSTYVL